MLSRVADSVFWMARYIERAENVARFIDVNHNLTLDLGDELGDQWAPLRLYDRRPRRHSLRRYKEATRENVQRFLAFDKENPNSISRCSASRPRKRPHGPRNHLVGHVGGAEPVLSAGARRREQRQRRPTTNSSLR